MAEGSSEFRRYGQQYSWGPDDWNYERDGKPNVVFWIHNGDHAEDVVLNFGRYLVSWDAVQEFSTYDEAERYRDDLIKLIGEMEESTAE